MAASVKNGNSHRGPGGGRPYGLMLLLALGAAILGVMVLHKLREGRLFSLLVKEKDHELLSLHLLLQKQREFNKQAQRKLEETKMNLYSVTAQKSDVEGRLMEVNSLLSSLKDEQKILEAQLEEKRSEINQLRQQQNMMPAEEIRFTDTTNQNQDESEHPNSHLEEPASVWSVSSDDPSNPPINSTDDAVKSTQSDETKLREVSENGLDRSVQAAYSSKNETESSNGLDSGMSASSKQGKLRTRKWRDVLRRAREQNEVEASRKEKDIGQYGKRDEAVVPVKEDLPNVAGNVTRSSLEVNAETKQDQGGGSKEVEKGSDQVEEEDKIKH